MYNIYGAAGSGSVAVEAVLELIGAPYQVLVEAPVWEGETERAKVIPVNPMAQLPVLVTEQGEVITESAAILLWLAEQHPEANLAPKPGSAKRAQFLRWMSFIPAAIYSMYWVRDEPERLAGDNKVLYPELLQRTADRIAHCWHVMDSQLTPQPFLLGQQMSVLDIYVTVASRWTPRRQRFYQVAPAMAGVVRLIDTLPQLQAFWAKRFPFATGWEG
ncbi:glutathione S-transferase family protein [Rheinheimera aquimaris]|uniref:Glutathione S-transferase family protein n=1 Tax=Rheinheimera aquimaris TaxID=412437 RepID=A0ABP3NC01_9GAMM|nr:glutathione S-transferase family protein [Rheinheimera aquimaris]MCB5212255.1 glutathione S-transferase family protein [Rheinheimera aquimaris]